MSSRPISRGTVDPAAPARRREGSTPLHSRQPPHGGRDESARVGSIEVRGHAEIAREIGSVLAERALDVPVTPPRLRHDDWMRSCLAAGAASAARAAESREARRVPAGRQAAYAARGSSIDAGTISP
jgi:hypothetical protein